MNNRRQFDLVVFGSEPSGLAAAACVAKAGGTCAILKTGFERPTIASVCDVPNFVWRKLNLHETDLVTEPVSAFVSLFEGGTTVQTTANDQKTQEKLSQHNSSDGALWRDFKAELSRRQSGHASQVTNINEGVPSLLTMDGDITETMVSVLNDYFESDQLKIHLASVAGLGFGLGGEEPGSVSALGAALAKTAWRVRDADALVQKLNLVCERLGVENLSTPVRRIEARSRRVIDIDFELGDGISTQYVMACSERIARAAGLSIKNDQSVLSSKENAEALIRVKLSDQPSPPESINDDAIFFIAESVDEIRAAKDAVLEGRLPDDPPMMFEFGEKEIVVRMPYCPRIFQSENGQREWTGQDRQMLGAKVVQRLGRYLNGALENVQRTDVKLYGEIELDREHPLNEDAPEIDAPMPDMDEIGAATSLALRLISRD